MNKTLISVLLIALGSCSIPTNSNKEQESDYFKRFDDYEGFSLEQEKEIHRNFEYDFENWLTGGGGDPSRYIFLNMSGFFFSTSLNPTSKVKELPVSINQKVKSFLVDSKLGSLSLDEYIQKAPVDGIIILHKGNVVYEEYPRMYWNDKHIWFSVSKTLVSTSIAILEDQEKIDTQAPISDYLKEFIDTDWQDIPIRDLLDMASGMDIEEKFSGDTRPNFLLFYDDMGFPNLKAKSTDPINFVKPLKKLKTSGEKFEYSSVNTEILMWLIEEVSQERYSNFIEKEIWQKTGAEFEAKLITTSNGDCFSAGGMNSTLRDLARYGLLFVPSSRMDNQIISDNYLKKIQEDHNENLTAKSWYSDELKNNSYQWDEVYDNGDFFKAGHNGQGLYISPSIDLVIAFFGTADENGQWNELPLISRQLAKSGLFEEYTNKSQQ